MKSSAFESKPFHSRSRGEIPGRARRKERLSRSKLKQAFLINSVAELLNRASECPGQSDDVTCHFVSKVKVESDVRNQVLRIPRTWELQPQAAMLKKQQLHIMTTLLFQKRKQMDRPVYDFIGSPLIVLRLSFITPNTPQTVLVYIDWLKKQKPGRSSSKLSLLICSMLCFSLAQVV